MAYQEWAEADYSRLYHTLLDDPKFATVYDDDRRWAWYTRLLIAADSTYPAPAPLPRGLPDDVLATLTELEVLVILRGSHYRIKALQSERERRRTGRAIGGHARVAGAQRDERGRLVAGANAGVAGDVAGDAGQPASGDAGDVLLDSSKPAKPSRVRDEKESLTRENPDARARLRRADIAALHDRGWKRVTKAQRAVLDEILARHDVTGPEFAAEAIRATPDGADPLEAVMTADRLWQDAQRRRADGEEAAWAETKAEERKPTKLGQVLRAAAADPEWMTAKAGKP